MTIFPCEHAGPTATWLRWSETPQAIPGPLTLTMNNAVVEPELADVLVYVIRLMCRMCFVQRSPLWFVYLALVTPVQLSALVHGGGGRAHGTASTLLSSSARLLAAVSTAMVDSRQVA